MRRIIALSLVVALISLTIGLVPAGSALAAIGQPVVTLSNYAPGAGGVQYTITFGLGGLSISSISYFVLRHVQLSGGLTSNLTPSNGLRLLVNGASSEVSQQQFQEEGDDVLNLDDYKLTVWPPPTVNPLSTSVTIVLPAGIGLVNPAAQPTWSADSHYGNNPAQNQWTVGIDVYADSGVSSAVSVPYTLLAPGVRDVRAAVTPSVVGSVASWDIAFTTGPSGALAGGIGATIDVQFPSGFSVPMLINASAVGLRIGAVDATASSVLVTGQTMSVRLPSTLYIPASTSVRVLVRVEAGIVNTLTEGSGYVLSVRTTGDDVFVASATFQIAASQVSGQTVAVSPAAVSSIASYALTFRTSGTGALVASTGTIAVTFPPDVFLPGTISASNVSVNSVPLSSAPQVSLRTVTLRVPQSISASSPVTVVFLSNVGLRNPAAAGSYALTLSTSADPGSVAASFSVSASRISAASVTVTPDTAGTAGFYILNFTLGSGGTLYAGNQIILSFPTGTQVAPSMPTSAVTINGRSLTQAPSVNGSRVSLVLDQTISANAQVVVIISLAAGIRNPRLAGTYSIALSTTAETTPVDSQPFSVRDGARTSHTVTPVAPDGISGYYVTQPKVIIVGTAPVGLSYTIKYRMDQGEFRTYATGTELAIPDGQHVIEYYAEDANGTREDTKSAQFKVFLGRPTVVITAPSGNAVVRSSSVVVSGTTSGATGLTVNGQSVQLAADGSFSREVTLAAEGAATIAVRAVNQAGGTADAAVKVTYTRQVRILLQVDYTKAYVNDAEVALEAPPTIRQGRVLVPARFISESFGFGVAWDPIFNIVTIQAGGKTMRLQVGNSVADVFGKATRLDVPPTMIGGRLFVPLSFVGTSFGASVVWDGALRIVRITYPAE